MSEFSKWFEAQYGERQQSRELSDEVLRGQVLAGKCASEILDARRLWDARQSAALRAYYAREHALKETTK